jgi:hypothetical protein
MGQVDGAPSWVGVAISFAPSSYFDQSMSA